MEKEKKKEEQVEKKLLNEKTEEVKEEKTKKEDKDEIIENLTNQVKELQDKNIRISADMINSLRRKDEEMSRMLKYASEDIIKELIIVCDNFERAISMDDDNLEDEVSKFLQGMKMIYNAIKNILAKNEVIEIDCLNKEFDPSFHQAVLTEEKEGVESNIVIEVLQKGYIYKEKVIRPAMVKVSK